MSSLSAYLGQIENHIVGGRRGQTNTTFVLSQIADEFVQECGAVLLYRDKQKKGEHTDWDACAQHLPSLTLTRKPWVTLTPDVQALLAALPVVAAAEDWHHTTIPHLLGVTRNVRYFGPAGAPEPWQVVSTLSTVANDQWRRVARLGPLVYINGTDAWLTGRSGRLPQVVRASLIVEDPRQAFRLGLTQERHPIRRDEDQTLEMARWPIDPGVAQTAIERLVLRYKGTHGIQPVPFNDGNAAV
jgi:hypothetical protein